MSIFGAAKLIRSIVNKTHHFNFLTLALTLQSHHMLAIPESVTLMHPLRANKTRITAIIAIVAVLLLFVAPVVSKSVMHHDMMMSGDMPSAMSEMPSAMAGHEGMQGMDSMHQHHSTMPTNRETAHIYSDMNGMACGYCDLLIHVPFLLWVFATLLLFLVLSSRSPLPAYTEKPYVRRRSRNHYPRAPPVVQFTFSCH